MNKVITEVLVFVTLMLAIILGAIAASFMLA